MQRGAVVAGFAHPLPWRPVMPFLSAEPRIRLTKAFSTPYRNVVATAKTCYSSKGIVEDANVGGREQFAPLAQSIYEAGHHTTFQHAHFQFAMENVSRHFIWSFLHSHPFYNSEQVSQRCLPLATRKLQISTARSDERAGVLGAAQLVIDERLQSVGK